MNKLLVLLQKVGKESMNNLFYAKKHRQWWGNDANS